MGPFKQVLNFSPAAPQEQHLKESCCRCSCWLKSTARVPTGVQRGAAATLLPAVMETLGLLPHPRRGVCPDRGVPVYFCRDREQLLLHALVVAHPGGHLCGVPASTQGQETGVVGLEPGLELELETADLWLHAVWERHRRTLHCRVTRTEVLQWRKAMSHWFQKVRKKNLFHKSKKGRFYGSHLWVVLKLLKLLLLLLLFSFLNTNQTCWNLHGGPLIAPAQVWAPKTSGSTPQLTFDLMTKSL